MNKLTETEKAYIAGVIDSDGCISFRRRNRKNNQNGHCDIIINIVNTGKILIDYVYSITGIGYITKKRGEIKTNRKDHYRWNLGSKTAWEFLELIYPYLVLKRKRAKLAISLGKRITKRIGYTNRGTSTKEIKIRHRMCERLRFYNRVGRVPKNFQYNSIDEMLGESCLSNAVN